MWEERHILRLLRMTEAMVEELRGIREEIRETKRHEVNQVERPESPNNRDDEDGTP